VGSVALIKTVVVVMAAPTSTKTGKMRTQETTNKTHLEPLTAAVARETFRMLTVSCMHLLCL
jgi:hypothetical protein